MNGPTELTPPGGDPPSPQRILLLAREALMLAMDADETLAAALLARVVDHLDARTASIPRTPEASG